MPSRGTSGVNNTAVARGKLVDGAAPRVENVQVIFHQAPSLESQRTSAGGWCSRRDGTLFVTLGDRSITEGRMQAQRMDGLLGKIVRINRTARSRRTTRSSARTACARRSGRSATATCRRRRCNPATGELWEVEHGTRGGDEINIARKGKDYGWPTIAYGIEYQGRPDHRRHHREGGHGAAALLLGSGHRAERHGVLHRATVPGVEGQPVHRRHGQQATSSRLTIKGENIVDEERLLTDLQPSANASVTSGRDPDGALYLLTDNAKGRILKLVPKPWRHLAYGSATVARGATRCAGHAPANTARAPEIR